MKLFDTHAHLTDRRFDKDRNQLIESFETKDIALIVDCSASQSDWSKVQKLTKHKMIYGTYGIHPHDAEKAKLGYLDEMQSYLSDEKAVAVGEIGLDYHYDYSPRIVQQNVLREQIELAISLNMPVVLHEREAHEDMLKILKNYKGKLRGVLHCYSGSVEMMPQFLDLGLYLGFGGTSTFHNARKTRNVVQSVPLDRMLIETDSPYLTPVPFRGERNDPTYVRYVCENIAQLRMMDIDEVAQITLENGKKLFNIA